MRRRLATMAAAFWAASLGLGDVSGVNAAENLEPIMLVTNQVCTCSPAVTYLDNGAVSGWQHVNVPAVEVNRVPTMAPAGTPWLQSDRRNLAPLTLQAARPLAAEAVPVQSWKPVIPLSAPVPATSYQLGKGLVGQPKVYVPGQPIRNFLRYLSP